MQILAREAEKRKELQTQTFTCATNARAGLQRYSKSTASTA